MKTITQYTGRPVAKLQRPKSLHHTLKLNVSSTVAALLWFGFSLCAEEKVDVKSFFESVQGEHQILLAHGKRPKELSDVSEVITDSQEGILSMPYCPSTGVCDPGYLFFNYKLTELTKEMIDSEHFLFTLETKEGGKILRYTWEQDECSISFTNYQYLMPDKSVTILQHVLKKMKKL